MRALNNNDDGVRPCYLSELFTESNLLFRLVPMLLTAVTITMLRPAAIRQYSMAVAPVSSLKNFAINARI
jgi:hypothetical protein